MESRPTNGLVEGMGRLPECDAGLHLSWHWLQQPTATEGQQNRWIIFYANDCVRCGMLRRRWDR